ncbi:recombinase family protein [Streptosporangium nondiastaticum]|uniref:recombinase family protein n=1 Tax=Streptosporangium nondiastaticum TaxID=35764 RepID=UPI0031F89863
MPCSRAAGPTVSRSPSSPANAAPARTAARSSCPLNEHRPPRLRVGVEVGGQKLERQIDALNAAGCRRIFADKKSGKNADRPELAACHAFLTAGDTLVAPSLDRYGRSLADLITMVGELRHREIGFTSLHEHLDTTTPGGRLVFHVFAALAEFIRELIVAGTREGLAAARARGRVGGRPTVVTPRSCAPPATCSPTPSTPSPPSPSCSE